jgi:hypothetical protein
MVSRYHDDKRSEAANIFATSTLKRARQTLITRWTCAATSQRYLRVTLLEASIADVRRILAGG